MYTFSSPQKNTRYITWTRKNGINGVNITKRTGRLRYVVISTVVDLILPISPIVRRQKRALFSSLVCVVW